MKKILLTLAFTFAPFAANAETFTYKEMCWYLGKQNHPWIEKAECTITEVRNRQGFLDKRTITARLNSDGKQIVYTVKSWFDKKGFMTWDSDRKYTYQINYSIVKGVPPTVARQANLPSEYGITQINKDLWVRQISWD